jgi:hypothetical protein
MRALQISPVVAVSTCWEIPRDVTTRSHAAPMCPQASYFQYVLHSELYYAYAIIYYTYSNTTIRTRRNM